MIQTVTNTLATENRRYWDRRAPSYTDVIKKNLGDGWDAVWADMLISRFPARASTRSSSPRAATA